MSLYFRLLLVIVFSLFKPQTRWDEKVSINLRVLPNDIDINGHLNNGRYLTLLDLCSVALFIRTGTFRQMFKHKCRPIIGGSIISYRKSLSLFEKCTVSIQIKAWDERWNFFEFEFKKANGQTAAAGYCKGIFVSSQGSVTNEQADQIFELNRGRCDVLPPAVENWIRSEQDLAAV